VRLFSFAAAACIALAAACGGGSIEHSIPTEPYPPDTTADSVASPPHFAGFDIALYPGDAAMKSWTYPASPYHWVGYYLPAPCHRDASWSGTRARLASFGWGLAPLYVGQQDWASMSADRAPANAAFVSCSASLLSSEQGLAEAADAVALMRADGFADGSTIFLDVEPVTTVSPPLLAYVTAWVSAVLEDGHYLAGIYAGKSNVPTFYDAILPAYHGRRIEPPFWVSSGANFSIDAPPANVGFSFARVWQGRFNVSESYNGVRLTIDVDVASTRSPGTP
jgi:hypothetical protein